MVTRMNGGPSSGGGAEKLRWQELNEEIKNWFAVCLIRAFDVGETQQKLYDDIHAKWHIMSKSEADKIIVAEKDLKKYCNVDTDKAVEIMENIIDGMEKERSIETMDRLIINHDTEIVDALKKAPRVKWQVG